MSNKHSTLVILSPGFPENEADTTCLPAQQVFVKLLKREYPSLDIVVIAFQYPFLEANYEWKGVRVISLNGRNRGKINRLRIWLKAWRTLKRINEQNNIIGIFSFWCGECALVGKWFGKNYSIEHHCWILGQDAKKENNYIKWIRPVAGDLVAMSDFLAREFNRNHRIDPLYIIPNGIDPDLYDPGPPGKDIDVLGAGSLISLKKYDLFLQIILRCKKQLPGIKAVICGKGPEEKKLSALIRQYHLTDNLILAGEKEHPEVLRLMQRSKVFLHTSSYEGFSTVCLEALYAGSQVVSYVKPMEREIPHWHVVTSPQEMSGKVLEILQQRENDPSPENVSASPDDPPAENDPSPGSPSRPVLLYPMRDSVRAVMQLYDYNE